MKWWRDVRWNDPLVVFAMYACAFAIIAAAILRLIYGPFDPYFPYDGGIR